VGSVNIRPYHSESVASGVWGKRINGFIPNTGGSGLLRVDKRLPRTFCLPSGHS